MRFSIVFLIYILAFTLNINGQSWNDLNNGTNYFVRTLYSDTIENKLYVGGDFWEAGGLSAFDIASWNGYKWDSLGSGMCYPAVGVTSICTFHDTLIVGGGFLSAGCNPVQYLSRWYNNEWHSFGQPNGYVGVLYVYEEKLYVGGAFDSIGGIQANGLAKWDGESWSTVGDLPDYTIAIDQNVVNKILIFNGTIYIAGILVDSSQSAVNFASYDGQQWKYHHILNGPFSGGYPAIAYKNELYMIGLFLKSEGNAGNCIMKFNGLNWEDVGGGITSKILYPQLTNAIVYHDKLYVVGIFDSAGSIPATNIAAWDGFKWCGFGNYIDNKIDAIESFQDTLYIAGGFRSIDNDTVNYIARWTNGGNVDTCSIPLGSTEMISERFFFSFYPNPANNQLHISYPLAQSSKPTLIITNLMGEKLLIEPITSTDPVIDISILSYGIYLIGIKTEIGYAMKKFVKQ